MFFNKKPNLYLHVGLHKTGTTSIQTFLSNNLLELEKYNLFYPTFYKKNSLLNKDVIDRFLKKNKKDFVFAHHRLFRALRSEDINLNHDEAVNSILQYKKICQIKNLNMILSAENISGFFKQEYSSKTINSNHFNSNIKLYFKDFNIIPIVVFRNHYDYFLSFYSEKTRNKWGESSMKKTFATYLYEQANKLPNIYSHIYELLTFLSTDKRVIAITFEETISGNLVRYFLNQINCDFNKAINNYHIRKSFSVIALELKRFISIRIKTKRGNELVNDFLFSKKYLELENKFIESKFKINFNSKLDFIFSIQGEISINSYLNDIFNKDLDKLKSKINFKSDHYNYKYINHAKHKDFYSDLKLFFEEVYQAHLIKF